MTLAEEHLLMGNVVNAARRYVGSTDCYEDTQDWQDLIAALEKLDLARDTSPRTNKEFGT